MNARYLRLFAADKLRAKTRQALELLAKPCRVCPRYCRIDRLAGGAGRLLDGPPCVRIQLLPSGTIFFSHCNLKCVFCQNHYISQGGDGRVTSPERLAAMMLELQRAGCHNINFVTPEHVVAQIVDALPLAIEGGLTLPLVYNTSAFDSPESLAVLDGLIDIYMPDFKFWDAEAARRYVKAVRYPEVARHSVKEMFRQVGNLVCDAQGVARSGLVLRHLVMPGGVAGTRDIMRFLASELNVDTYVNIMDQYRPAAKSDHYAEIHRRLESRELAQAMRDAREAGLYRFDVRGSDS